MFAHWCALFDVAVKFRFGILHADLWLVCYSENFSLLVPDVLIGVVVDHFSKHFYSLDFPLIR